MKHQTNFDTPEAYLVSAITEFAPIFEGAGAPLPKVRVACGWPSSRGCAGKGRALGECWDKTASSDKVAQIFISPFLLGILHVDDKIADGQGVLPTLVHELVHAALGNEAGHGKEFKALATKLGLEGRMIATRAGAELLETCKSVAEKLGPYPHAQIIPGEGAPVGKKKKQTTRMIKCECAECGYTARVSRKWLEHGAPVCPKHGAMQFDETVLDEIDEEAGDE